MPLPLEKFIEQLENSGILSGDTLKGFLPPNATPKDGEELARELVRKKKLTKFQAEEVYRGKAKSLVLGNYVLMEKIGAGGMGQVFKAEHRRMKRIVAVKLLPTEMTKDKAAIARFEREVQAAAKISHPNIVAAHDADCADGVHFLVMELVAGDDLSALVKKNGPLPVDKAANYILQAARGLEAAHKKGIIHRDIKPANLLLDTEGTVKILDMGLARLTLDSDAPPQADLTSTGTIMGTVDYMSPEQALDMKTADARADIYSLGCSLYFLLTGKASYQGDTLMKKLLAHREQPIPNLRLSRPEVPEKLEAIFQKMIAKKVDDRYQTMTKVVAALEALPYARRESTSQGDDATVAMLSDEDRQRLSEANRSRTELLPASPLVKVVATEKTKHLFAKIVGGTFATIIAPILVAFFIRYLEKRNPPPDKTDVAAQKTNDSPDTVAGTTTPQSAVPVPSGGSQTNMIEIPDRARMETSKLPGEVAKPSVAEPASTKGPILAFQKPGFDDWVKQVQALPAEKQLEAVAKKLKDLNPGFDGNLLGFLGSGSPKIENGVPVELHFVSDNVTDLSPVRALPGLKTLACLVKGNVKLRISDLSPLQGMNLTYLNCNGTHISDLSPLRGMPLDTFLCNHTEVSDLSPLKGMSLTSLEFGETSVDDLSPLQGMPLRNLRCSGTQVSDVSPLQGINLTKLFLSPKTITKGMDVIRQMKSLQLASIGLATTDQFTPEDFWKKYDAGEFGKPTSAMITSKIDPDRRAAEWVLNKGGTVVLSVNGKTTFEPKNVGDLPSGSFTTVHVTLPNIEITGRDLEVIQNIGSMNACKVDMTEQTLNAISQMKRLQLLNLSGTRITDQDLKHLEPLSDLRLLQFFNAKNVTSAGISALQLKLPNCKIEWDDPTKPKAKFHDPSFQLWMKDVAALPAEQQVDAVAKKLVELNSGFDGKVTPTIQNGVVTEFEFVTDNVTDMSPIRALIGLKSLQCNGSLNGKKSLSDLSPLQGMKLRSLICSLNSLSDLSPLEGMPLSTLGCYGTKVFDLSPLKGMQLEYLNIDKSPVSDLLPLEGMPLTTLVCSGTHVSDLTPVKAMKLTRLIFTPKTITQGIDVIRQMKSLQFVGSFYTDKFTPAEFWKKYDTGEFGKPITDFNSPAFQQWMKEAAALPANKQGEAVAKKLQELNFGFDGKVKPTVENGVITGLEFQTDNVTDISPVRVLTGLKVLICSGTHISKVHFSDLSPLRGMKLTSLNCNNTSVSDLSPLAGMPLTNLICYATKIADLSPLKGMGITRLNFSTSLVADLSPLTGMPLTEIACSNTLVADLLPLIGIPLLGLDCGSTHVSDLTPLMGMKLARITFTPKDISKGLDVIRQMKSLQIIGTIYTEKFPAAAFWKKYDAGDFGKPITDFNSPAFQQWMKDVAAMPAEKQVEAVAKKLMELNPGFDGKETHKIENGLVTWFELITDNVTDISPVRAFVELKSLEASGSNSGKKSLSDLSPLQGMKLKKLGCGLSSVSDLSPLKGMELTSLVCYGTKISDLSALKRMPLNYLNFGGTKVSDLLPLSELPLTVLSCGKTHISDFTPLKGMNLAKLNFTPRNVNQGIDVIRQMKSLKTIEYGSASNEQFASEEFWKRYDAGEFGKPIINFDDSAFQQWLKDVPAMSAEKQVESVSRKLMELNPAFDGKLTHKVTGNVVTELRFVADHVTDISPVAALAGLKVLDSCGGEKRSQLSDLSPLKRLKLSNLNCSRSSVADLSPLEKMPLTHLQCFITDIFDFTPLKGMQLNTLNSGSTLVSDLSPLSGMPLVSLACNNTQVAQLSPLKGMPLTAFSIDSTPVSDLSPLQGMPLQRLSFTPKNITQGIDAIRQMKDLKFLGTVYTENFSTEEFWKRYDAGEFGKPKTDFYSPAFKQWMTDVAAMPAEKQIDVVARKLMELNLGFDGKVTHKVEAGVVIELRLNSDRVADISPVRGLAGLRDFYCSGTSRAQSQLSDLSPLRGMSLKYLNCGDTKVLDLSPLNGMTLARLDCYTTNITDLSPLKQQIKMASLSCNNTLISDLSPLQSCTSLTVLKINNTKVTADSVAALQKVLPDCKIEQIDTSNTITPANALTNDPDRRAAEWALGQGGHIVAIEPGKTAATMRLPLPTVPFRVQSITFPNDGKPIQDDDLACLEGLTELRELDITRLRGYTDSGLKHLSGLTKLTKLSCFDNNQVTDAGMQYLSGLKQLEELHIAATMATEKGLKLFVDCPLRKLSVGGRAAADGMLPSILEFQALTNLNVHGNILQDANIQQLQGLPKLNYLALLGSPISDQGLATLATLKLNRLELKAAAVSDVGLKHLHTMTALTKFWVSAPKVTAAGVADLQKALPDCKVEWDDPAKPKTKSP